jgi:hypothetical protein
VTSLCGVSTTCSSFGSLTPGKGCQDLCAKMTLLTLHHRWMARVAADLLYLGEPLQVCPDDEVRG